MRPARLLPDCPPTHQQQQQRQQQRQQQQQQQRQRLRQGKESVSRQTSTGAKSKDVYRLPLSLSRAKEATPKSSTTTTEEVPRPAWHDLRVQRIASAEPTTTTTATTTTTVRPSTRQQRQQRRRRNPGALAFPRRCGAVVRSTGVG
ncbi:bromodomain-containing protein DDB_G0278469-like [Temnothorax curvispinosus]|uniref:Bromodomain-containing protein DDB_G0278469-like n=1 Tax=Temnothorax curvispinosus TaxID=300111 RepID=A0A6J1PMP8_9HYME|nr:bromodomain-containing protein DDB_G0278469-like [Temnothorax curvispinosus]